MNDSNDMNNINNENNNITSDNLNNNVQFTNNNTIVNDTTPTSIGRRSNDNNDIEEEPKKKTSIVTIIIRVILLIIILILLYILLTDDGKDIVYRSFILKNIDISELSPNEYYREYDYDYVQITDNFVASDKQHLLNIYYTIANSGATEFTFACSNKYESCLDDVQDISNSEVILSNIKAFIHPFNGFTSIGTQYSSHGEVVLTIYRSYTDEEIKAVEDKISEVVKEYGANLTDPKEIIRTYHNYIINNTKYDSARSEGQTEAYKSDIAYGPLLQGYALCGGYTDAMALFLDYYNIRNFKINSDTHIWNAVYYDNNWYHVDLTWDDPITTSGKDVLRDSYLLINTDELLALEKVEHDFDMTVFKEVNNSI